MSNITEKEIEEVAEKRYGTKRPISHTQRACFKSGAEWYASIVNKTGGKGYEFFKGELLAKCDRLLRDKGVSSAETNECISLAIDDLKNVFHASIVNERKGADKVFRIDEIRGLISKIDKEITIGKFVEILNEKVNERKDSVGSWISVEDSLPEYNKNVLVFSKSGNTDISFVDIKGKLDDFGLEVSNGDDYYTHWMPLPAPPESQPKKESK